MTTEAEKFLAWYQLEQGKGLVDIKFFTGDLSAVTSETFFAEANQMNTAESLVYGNYPDSVERVDSSDLFSAAYKD